MTTKTLTDLEHKLLVALWRHVWFRAQAGHATVQTCRECGASDFEKHTVKHRLGCALFGLDPALLAGLDAFEIAEGEPV